MLLLDRDVTAEFAEKRFAIAQGGDFRLLGHFDDFYAFCKSWENLGEDPYCGQKGRGARYRKYSDFEFNPTTQLLTQLDHRHYEQSMENNKYVGGLKRDFEDFSRELIASPILQALVRLDFEVYKSVLLPEKHDELWQCQIHQIRIEINSGQWLEITPEGIHCDGYPFSAVHFGGKSNIAGAESQLLDWDNNVIGAVTYANRFDTTFFLDREMQHYVTPAETKDKSKPGYRQIIAISFSQPGGDYETVR